MTQITEINALTAIRLSRIPNRIPNIEVKSSGGKDLQQKTQKSEKQPIYIALLRAPPSRARAHARL
jgi:hypothetical protein